MTNKSFSVEVSSGFTAFHSHDKSLNEPAHNHNFKYTITLKGPLNDEGYLVDFRKIEDLLTQISKELENKNLNTIIPVPTTENLAYYIFCKVKKVFPQACKIQLKEKENYQAVYEEI